MHTSTHPERIEAAATAIAVRSREITDLREQLAITEAHHTLDVQSETNEHNKPQYPNEEARHAAHTLRLADDESYRQLTWRLRDAEEERARLSAEHERLRAEFKLYVLDRQEQVTRPGDRSFVG